MKSTFIFEHIPCDLCGADKYFERYRKPDDWLFLNQFQYPVVECTVCGLVYVNPRPVVDDTGRFYPPGYHDGRNDKEHLERYALQYKYLEAYDFSTVLDIGCARGDWLGYIESKTQGIELHGVDAFSNSVNYSSVRFQKTALGDAVLENGYFDLVTAWAVLEHVHSPSTYFEVVSKVLKDGGKFIFLVSNSESFYGKYAYSEDVPRHLYHFSEHTVAQYAENNRLRIVDTFYDDRFWDGRGTGTFRFGFGKLLGVNWNKISLNRFNPLQKLAMKIGSMVDKAVFHCHWEARFRKSGIIVFVMEKSE